MCGDTYSPTVCSTGVLPFKLHDTYVFLMHDPLKGYWCPDLTLKKYDSRLLKNSQPICQVSAPCSCQPLIFHSSCNDYLPPSPVTGCQWLLLQMVSKSFSLPTCLHLKYPVILLSLSLYLFICIIIFESSVCLSVCLCRTHIPRTVRLIKVTAVTCIIKGPGKCSVEFGAIGTHNTFNINTPKMNRRPALCSSGGWNSSMWVTLSIMKIHNYGKINWCSFPVLCAEPSVELWINRWTALCAAARLGTMSSSISAGHFYKGSCTQHHHRPNKQPILNASQRHCTLFTCVPASSLFSSKESPGSKQVFLGISSPLSQLNYSSASVGPHRFSPFGL